MKPKTKANKKLMSDNRHLLIITALMVLLSAPLAMAYSQPQALSSFQLSQLNVFDRVPILRGNMLSVVGPEGTATPGDTFEHTFTLVNKGAVTLPDTDYSDGVVTRLYESYEFTDPNGVVVQNTQVYTEVTSAVAASGTVSVPVSLSIASTTPSGSYGVVAILFSVRQTWSPSTSSWVTGSGTIIDQQGVKFTVSTPTPPPAPTGASLTLIISNLFASILCAIKQLFGLAC